MSSRKEANCTTELDYTEQTSWLLFLKYLDGLEEDKAAEAELHGKTYDYILRRYHGTRGRVFTVISDVSFGRAALISHSMPETITADQFGQLVELDRP